MTKVWNVQPQSVAGATDIAKDFSLAIPIAQLLVNRGLETHEAVDNFLNPRLKDLSDPFLLIDMGAATRRILKAITTQEKIIIFGDYDVDGMTSIALLLEVLTRLGAECGYFLPSRFADGYGLKQESVKRCIEDGARLIITVDCGTNSTQEIRYAKSRGVDTIVLDHHEHNAEPFEAIAVVNPKRKDSAYKQELASVGIAFKTAHAILLTLRDGDRRYSDTTREKPPISPKLRALAQKIDLKDILDLVAVGTVADMVPLLGENRTLVKAGLARFSQSTHPGLRILKDLAGVRDQLTGTDIAFRIAPRLNANGRLSDAQDSLALLRTHSESEAMVLAQKLHQENMRRQQIERQATEEAIAIVRAKGSWREHPILVLHDPRWHIGVVGIVATKIAKEFGKPAVVIGQDNGVGKGSARSIEGFNIAEALASASKELINSGGHAGAAGLTIDPERIDALRQALITHTQKIMGGRDLTPRLQLDMELPKQELNSQLIEQLRALEPYGIKNPRPLFATGNVTVSSAPRIVGKDHLKFQTRIKDDLFDVMGFRMAQNASATAVAAMAGRRLDIAYHPCINTYNGQTRLQLNLEDFRYTK